VLARDILPAHTMVSPPKAKLLAHEPGRRPTWRISPPTSSSCSRIPQPPLQRRGLSCLTRDMGRIVSVFTFPLRRPLVTTALLTGGLVSSSAIFGPIATLQGVTAAAGAIDSAYAATTHAAMETYWHFACPGRMAAINRMGGIASATPEELRYAADVKQACTP
jgi:hypothetical protein